jgi:hypothetical protein
VADSLTDSSIQNRKLAWIAEALGAIIDQGKKTTKGAKHNTKGAKQIERGMRSSKEYLRLLYCALRLLW